MMLLSSLALLLLGGASADKRAFEISDYYATAFPSSPSLAPDGKSVVFNLRRYDLAANESWFEIWRLDLVSGESRALTAGRHLDTAPKYSPDGKRLVFSSNRSGSNQLWVMPIDGGEPRQLTRFPAGVSSPVWSPDGRYLAVSAEMWPDCSDENGTIDVQRLEAREKANAADKLEVHVADDLLYRHWTSWKDGKHSHVLLVDAASGEVLRDLTPGPYDAPTFSLGGEHGYVFSPSGEELVFVCNRGADPAESTDADLWRVPIAGGVDPEILTESNLGWDGAPLISPDGRYLAYISQERAGYESDLRRLALLDLESRELTYLTHRKGFDEMVTHHAWTSDGRIVFQAEHHGRNPLYRISVAGGEPELLHTHASIDAWELERDGRGAVYVSRAVGAAPELYRSGWGEAPLRLTKFNAELESEVDVRPVEELWVEGDGGHPVHVFLVKPHRFDPAQRYPLILNVHGGPQSQWMDSYRGDWQVYPGKGYVVAFANPTGSTGYGQEFCDGINRDWGGRVFRDLMKVTDALAALPYVDAQRMGAMGWSYGGYMMMWFQGHTERFACQAAMMGLYDLRSFYGATEELWFPEHDLGGTPWTVEDYERWSPSNHAASFKTPALVITGELDYRVPYTQSLQYFTALRKQDIPARLVVFPEAGHWPGWREMIFYYNAHLDWFHRYLGGEPAPVDVFEHARGEARLAPAPSGG